MQTTPPLNIPTEPPQQEQPEIEQKPRFPLLVKSGLGFLWEVAKTVVISVIIIVLIRQYLFKPFYVKGASMEPTFRDDEYLIINEIDYRLHEPQRGDIIVLRYPADPKQYFIKRIVGLPGETVDIQDGGVWITNDQYPGGFQLDESAYLAADVQTAGAERIPLSADQYFVLGDNRPASLDSRSSILGPVPRSAIVGRTWFRVWPFSRLSAFPTLQYPASS